MSDQTINLGNPQHIANLLCELDDYAEDHAIRDYVEETE